MHGNLLKDAIVSFCCVMLLMNGKSYPESKKEKLQHQCLWLVVKENILDVGAKLVHATLEGVHVLRQG